MTARATIRQEGTCPSFVGRERELVLIWDQWQMAQSGGARAILVSGEPGIGKSRLLAEIGARAAAGGAAVLSGGASQAAGMPPYLPFLEALGGYIQQAPIDRLRRDASPAASILAGILPELALRLAGDDLRPAFPLREDQARLRLFQAVGRFLAAIGEHRREGEEEARGLVLILDDLQWADAASLELLCHVVRHEPAAPLLVLAACRNGEAEQNPALERAQDEMSRLRVLTSLTLAPLSTADTAVLATSYLGGPIDDRTGQMLYDHSEGSPFYAEEMLRDWIEAGGLVLREPESGSAGRAAWTLGTGRTSLPAGIAGAIRQRLARLPPTAVDLLRVAAIIGRTFSATLLAAVQGQDAETIEDCLDVAERAQLVHCDAAGLYTFSHDKTRECLYVEVSAARRRRLHERIGLALEAGPVPASAAHLADLAFHFAHSNDRARGVQYTQGAAEQALRAYAPAEAARHYRTALELLEPEDPRRGELLLELGHAALLAAADGEAAEAYQAAQNWLARSTDRQAHREAAARAAHGRGLAYWRLDRPEAAREAMGQALALLDGDRPHAPEAVRVRVDLASLLSVVLGHHDQALAYSRQALDMARQLGDGHLQAAASRTAGFLLVRENELAPGIALLEQALALARANDDPAEAAEGCACLAQAYCWSAQFERSRQVSEWREEFARRCQQPYPLSFVYTWLAFLAAARGDWPQAQAAIDRARPAVHGVSSAEPLAFWHQVRGYLAYQQGRYADAATELRPAIAIFREKHPGELILCLGLLGLALLAAGQGHEAQACLTEQEALLDGSHTGRLSALSASGCLALMAAAQGDTSRAATCYSELLACQGQHHWFLVDRILGQAAAAGGDWDAAAAHLAEAEAIARREGLRPELGRTLEAQAGLALARGEPSGVMQARACLGHALAVLEDLGLPAEVHRLRRQLQGLPHPPGPRHGPAPSPEDVGVRGKSGLPSAQAQGTTQTAAALPLPAGLSRREADVLRLVAAGMSNAQVARDMSLSESTVAHHLTSIFNKTGTDNRAAAVAFAIRHNLA